MIFPPHGFEVISFPMYRVPGGDWLAENRNSSVTSRFVVAEVRQLIQEEESDIVQSGDDMV
jgi:hypothetical protein